MRKNQDAVNRYLKASKEMFRLKQFKLASMIRNFKINNRMRFALHKLQLVEKLGKFHRWVGPEPTSELAEIMLRVIRESAYSTNAEVDKQLSLPLPPLHENGITTQKAIKHLKSLGCYRIIKITEEEM